MSKDATDQSKNKVLNHNNISSDKKPINYKIQAIKSFLGIIGNIDSDMTIEKLRDERILKKYGHIDRLDEEFLERIVTMKKSNKIYN